MTAELLLARMSGFGSAEALVNGTSTTSYAALLSRVEGVRSLLTERGVGPGAVVAMDGGYSPGTCAALLALAAHRAVVVPLDSIPSARRSDLLGIAEAEFVLTVSADGLPDLRQTDRSATHSLYGQLHAACRAGLVLFSSGTSGQSKASVLDLDALMAKYLDLPARRVLVFLSLDHIGGLNTLLHAFGGGGVVVTPSERTPDAVFAAVDEHRVDVLPTTPTFLTLVLMSDVLTSYDLSSLRVVSYGTEPMPANVLERLVERMPGVRFKQTYGLSELGILSTKSRSDNSLWLKIGGTGFDHRIVDDVLWIRSDTAMLGYLNAEAQFDADGYFNTQDVVRQDGDWIQILGRRSELINVGGEKVYPAEVENVLLELDNVVAATVRGKRSPVTGMIVAATVKLVEPEEARDVTRRVRDHCAARLPRYAVPMLVEVSTSTLHSERFKKIRVAE